MYTSWSGANGKWMMRAIFEIYYDDVEAWDKRFDDAVDGLYTDKRWHCVRGSDGGFRRCRMGSSRVVARCTYERVRRHPGTSGVLISKSVEVHCLAHDVQEARRVAKEGSGSGGGKVEGGGDE